MFTIRWLSSIVFILVGIALTGCGRETQQVSSDQHEKEAPSSLVYPRDAGTNFTAGTESTTETAFVALCRSDPSSALLRIRDSEDPYAMAASAVDSLPIDALPDLFRTVDDLLSGRGNDLKHSIFRRMSAEAPEEGIKLFNGIGSGSVRTHLLGTFLGSLKPRVAVQFVSEIEDLPFPEDRRIATSQLRKSLSKLPHAEIATLIQDNSTNLGKGSVILYAYGASLSDQEDGYKRISQLPPDARKYALKVWAAHSSSQDAVAMAQRISTNAIPVDDAKNIVSTVAGNYAHYQSASEAAEWAASLNDEALIRSALPTVMNAWLSVDSSKASEWVSSMEAGAARDWAARAIVGFLVSHSDIEGAEIWAAQIENAQAQAHAQGYLRNAKGE